MIQLSVGLKKVEAAPAIEPPRLKSLQFNFNPVVMKVSGQLAVPDVKVDEWERWVPILTIWQLLDLGLKVHRMPYLFMTLTRWTTCTVNL